MPATPAPKELSGLAVLLVPSTIHEVNAAAQAALVGAGYTVIVDPRAPHDATGKLSASAVAVPSLFQVQVNGVAQSKQRLTVSLAIEAGGRVIDQVQSQFETANGQVTPDQLAGLVNALNGSEPVKRFAADRAATAKQHTDEVTAQKEAEQGRVAAAETEWDGIVGECRQPKALTSCDALKAWIAKNAPPRRSGIDAPPRQSAQQQKKQDEARQTLESAAPALKDFAEADAFVKLDLPGCAAGTSPSAFDAVQKHVQRFPNGKHADELKRALGEGQQKMIAKQAEEQRRADAEEKAGARRQQQANCKAGCAAKCVAFTKDDAHTKCMEQCAGGCN